jgi:2-enoate reductase
LADEKADFILMGRALLADPDLPIKAREERIADIRRCIGCNTGCAARDVKKFPTISCAVNATVGREGTSRIQPAAVSKKVMVIGAGPGGMEAARVATMRGHQVVIYEKSERLGGQLVWAAMTQHNRDIAYLIRFLTRQIQILGIECHTGIKVNPELIEEKNPDAVVMATGALPVRPDVTGIHSDHVVFATDVIAGKIQVGHRAVVVGGGLIGMETGLALAKEGNRVTLIEMGPKIGASANSLELLALMERFLELGVQILTDTQLIGVHPDRVAVTIMDLTKEHELLSIPADTVVLATGYRSIDGLSPYLKNSGREVYVIGDCREPRKIIDAIHEGYLAGLEI